MSRATRCSWLGYNTRSYVADIDSKYYFDTLVILSCAIRRPTHQESVVIGHHYISLIKQGKGQECYRRIYR